MGLIAFALHLVWEYAQCIPFFVHGTLAPTHSAMILATLGDVVITWVAYSVVAAAHQNLYWFSTRWRWTHWSLLIMTALVLSIAIEGYALKTDRWGYTESAPLLFGHISLLPVLQLVLLFPATFLLLKKFGTYATRCSC